MDAVLTWLSDNRDALIIGVVLLVLAVLGKWGTAIPKRLRERRRLAKEQKEREEERQHCLQEFLSKPTRRVYLPPETAAGQVIMGYLSDYPHWKFLEESDRGDVVDLTIAVNATSLANEIAGAEEPDNELGPAERAARTFHGGAEVTRGPFVDAPTVTGTALYGYVPVNIRVSKVPD